MNSARQRGLHLNNMNFTNLKLQTFRSAPADARGVGAEYLYRAGYLDRDFELTNLGKLAIDRVSRSFGGDLPVGAIETLGGMTLLEAQPGAKYLLSENGKIEILYCPSCYYGSTPEHVAVNRSPTYVGPELPVKKIFTPNCGTIKDLANFLNIPEQQTAKALLFTRISDNKVIFVVVRGDQQLSLEKLERSVGKVRLATPEEIFSIGAVPGYASPIGTHDALIAVDQLIPRSPNLAAGANESGYHLINTNYGRDYLAFLITDLVTAEAGDACPHCGTPLVSGKAYSFHEGEERYLLTAIAENLHDERGLTLSPACAPANVYLMNLPGKELDTAAVLGDMEKGLASAGFTVLIDDRSERAGVKFNDADLIGLPIRVAVGERALRENAVEVKARTGSEAAIVPIDQLVEYCRTNFLKGN